MVDEQTWLAFQDALERPAKAKKGQQSILAEPATWEGKKDRSGLAERCRPARSRPGGNGDGYRIEEKITDQIEIIDHLKGQFDYLPLIVRGNGNLFQGP